MFFFSELVEFLRNLFPELNQFLDLFVDTASLIKIVQDFQTLFQKSLVIHHKLAGKFFLCQFKVLSTKNMLFSFQFGQDFIVDGFKMGRLSKSIFNHIHQRNHLIL